MYSFKFSSYIPKTNLPFAQPARLNSNPLPHFYIPQSVSLHRLSWQSVGSLEPKCSILRSIRVQFPRHLAGPTVFWPSCVNPQQLKCRFVHERVRSAGPDGCLRISSYLFIFSTLFVCPEWRVASSFRPPKTIVMTNVGLRAGGSGVERGWWFVGVFGFGHGEQESCPGSPLDSGNLPVTCRVFTFIGKRGPWGVELMKNK